MAAPHLPPISFGTYTVRGDTCREATLAALRCGYRRLDTAAVYKNEEEVGLAIRQSGVPRSELRITTKLAPQQQKGASAAVAALKASLAKLGLDYVDCYLMHWPGTSKKKVDDPVNVTLRCESWRGMCEAKAAGLTREVGVCNFTLPHFRSLEAAELPAPQVHQLELHPLCRQRDVVDYCRARGMLVEAYSPLGSGDPRVLKDPVWAKHFPAQQQPKQPAADGTAEEEPVAKESLGADPTKVAQSLLCWSMRQGFAPVVRSTNPTHIAADLEPEGFDPAKFARFADAADALAVTKEPGAADTHVCWFGGIVV